MLTLTSLKKLSVHRSIHPKQNQKRITHESNKLRMFQTKRKNQLKCKKNKSNFMNVKRDKFVISIRWGKTNNLIL